jgi:glutaminase
VVESESEAKSRDQAIAKLIEKRGVIAHRVLRFNFVLERVH